MTVQFESIEKANVIEVAPRPSGVGTASGFYPVLGKRLVDLFLIIISAPVWLAVMGIVTITLLLTGQKPFYIQDRIGRRGSTFRMIKFRSMVQGAEEGLEAYLEANPDARAEWDHHQKLRRDPRITRVGAFLRRTSMDELPQILNVLIGDMTLVGPRPMLPEQRDLYSGGAYFDLRPGITGPWQVSDRHASAFADRVLHDNRYARNVSFGYDVSLIASTFRAVVRGTGC